METRVVTKERLEQCEDYEKRIIESGEDQVFSCYFSAIANQLPFKPVKLRLGNVETGKQRLSDEIYDAEEIEEYRSKQLAQYQTNSTFDPMMRELEVIIAVIPVPEIGEAIASLVSEHVDQLPSPLMLIEGSESEGRKKERAKKIAERIEMNRAKHEKMNKDFLEKKQKANNINNNEEKKGKEKEPAQSRANDGNGKEKMKYEVFAKYLMSPSVQEQLEKNIIAHKEVLLAAHDEDVLRRRMIALFDGLGSIDNNDSVYLVLKRLVEEVANLSVNDIKTQSPRYQIYLRVILGSALDDLFDENCDLRKEIYNALNIKGFLDELTDKCSSENNNITINRLLLYAYLNFINCQLIAYWKGKNILIPVDFTTKYNNFFLSLVDNNLAILQSATSKEKFIADTIKEFIEILSDLKNCVHTAEKNKEDKEWQIQSDAYDQMSRFFPHRKEKIEALYEEYANKKEQLPSEIIEMEHGNPEDAHFERFQRPGFFTRHSSAFFGVGMGAPLGAFIGSIGGIFVGVAFAVLTGGGGILSIPICMGIGAALGGSGGSIIGGTCGILDDDEINNPPLLALQEEPEPEQKSSCSWFGILTCLGIKKENPYQLLNQDDEATPYRPMDTVGESSDPLSHPGLEGIESDMGDALDRYDIEPFPSPRGQGGIGGI